MQLVQTRIRFGAPFTSALTACRFTFQRRRVTLWACEMLLPNCGPFPQTSHTCAIALLPILDCFVLPRSPALKRRLPKAGLQFSRRCALHLEGWHRASCTKIKVQPNLGATKT